MTKVNSYNEWDPLKEVIVGIASNARFPQDDLGMNINIAAEDGTLPDTSIDLPGIPEKIIQETNEDLDNFVQELEKLNVTVRRPDEIDTESTVSNGYWETTQYFNYCPRDVLIVFGDTIVESPNLYRSRYFETFSYRSILDGYMESGSKWITAPKPRLREDDFNFDKNSSSILKETDPLFEAANILRAGKDIIYLVSNSANMKGYTWLKNILGNEYRVHACPSIYSGTHIDTTLALLRPGLAVANPERVKKESLPDFLQNWDIIFSEDMIEKSYSDLPQLSSEWLGMNLFSISPDLAVVDADQSALIKQIESKGVDVLPLKLRHGRLLEGGFHCVTLDTHRDGELEDYTV